MFIPAHSVTWRVCDDFEVFILEAARPLIAHNVSTNTISHEQLFICAFHINIVINTYSIPLYSSMYSNSFVYF